MILSNNEQPQAPRVFPNDNQLRDVNGFIQKLTEEPSYTPRNMFEQFVLVTTGGSSRAYIYDIGTRSWKSVVIA